ncbi:MAG TPA: hypothetical protein VGN08_02340 [Solirubrobacteraceae bacterium]
MPQIGNGVEHCHNLVGVVPGGTLGPQRVQRVGYGSLAGAQLNDALGGEGDDGVRRVVVLLKAQGLSAEGAVDLRKFAV